jgi:hypothetical protein
MENRRPLGALVVLSLSAGSLLLGAAPSLAQTADELEQQYRREAMEQALQTREQYDVYGIRFDTDKASIQPGSEKLLDDIATALGNFPDWKLRIVGHTDATGNADHNRQLSLDRAMAVRAALESRGIDGARLGAAGLGSDRPVARDETDEGRALNRRVELARVTDAPLARELLKAMSDYMAAQDKLAVDYDATFEVVTHAGQKLALASSGTVSLDRPDHLRATRSGGFADLETVFDGTTLTLLGKGVNIYTQVEEPGSVDRLVDVMRDTYGRPLPAGDLLLSHPYPALMEEVYDIKDLGSGVIGGTECDWLAFRTEEVDWQIWIAHGDQPLPCRYVITTKYMEHAPQYTIDFRDWRTGDAVAADTYAFEAPPDATKIELDQLQAKMAELPGHFAKGGKQ